LTVVSAHADGASEAPRVVLSARGVTVRRDGRVVVAAASLDVRAGELHAICGPNGGGKSTLVSALLGQIPFTGEVRRALVDRARVGYVPQSFTVDRTLPVTVVELLALTRQRLPVALGVRVSTRARALAALAKVGMEALVDRRLGALSGGELRRALFANAIEPDPELLILDEPSAGVDAESARRVDDALIELKQRARTAVLLVSHDAAQIRRLADHVTWIDGGVKRTGAPADVLAHGALALVQRDAQAAT
jgi:zinc transport system ATP-binding protein